MYVLYMILLLRNGRNFLVMSIMFTYKSNSSRAKTVKDALLTSYANTKQMSFCVTPCFLYLCTNILIVIFSAIAWVFEQFYAEDVSLFILRNRHF